MLKTFSHRSLSALLVLSLSLSSLVILAPQANAASIHDNSYHPTENVIISDSMYSNCPVEDLTLSWSQYITDDTYSNGASNWEDMQASYNNAIENGSWAVNQTSTDYGVEGKIDLITVLWSETPATVNFVETNPGSYPSFDATQVHSVIIANKGYIVGGSDCTPSTYGYTPNQLYSGRAVGGDGVYLPALPNLFVANATVVYPPEYQGQQIKDSAGQEQELPIIRPDFTYALNNKEVKAHDYNTDLPTYTPEEGYTLNGYFVEWSLFKCDSFEEVTNLCHSDGETQLIDHQVLSQNSDYNFTVTDYSDYTLQAQYLVQECYRYPSYPATPDYCYYSDLERHIPDYEFTSTTVHLLVNGQSITGDTKNETCDISGYCQVDATICYSEEEFITQLTCRFNKSINTGLINPSINAFKNLLTSLAVPPNPTCDIPLIDVAIAPGKNFPLSSYSTEACASAAQFRSAFPIAPLLINFFLAFTLLVLIVRIINRLLDHEKNDLIEGVH
jgi:hypothetical protein